MIQLRDVGPGQRRFGAYQTFGDDSRTVERPGPGRAPTAFLIWRAGVNMSDGGADVFTRRSADLLMSEQASRGNLLSIDYDHLSLKENRPADAGRAAGWHRIAVRLDENGEPELWAVDVEWCQTARAGLEADPPEWRYFSPAFTPDEESGEILSYTNLAICVNPATWNNNQLACRASGRRTAMEQAEREKLAVLNALAALMNDEAAGDDAAAAAASYDAFGGSAEHDRLKALDTEGGDEAPVEETRADDSPAEEEKRAEGDGDDDEEKKRAAEAEKTRAAEMATRSKGPKGLDGDPLLLRTVKQLAAANEENVRKIARLEKAQESEAVELELRKRPDISDSLRKTLRTMTPGQVRNVLAGIPLASTAKGQAPPTTRGRTQGLETEESRRRDPAIDSEVAKAMRIPPKAGPVDGFGKTVNGRTVFHTVKPSEWRARRVDKLATPTRGAEGKA